MIPVSQPFLPPKDEYNVLISKIWDTKWLTNNGMFVQQLEKELLEYLNISSLHYVNNGTVALQLALKSLDIKNEVITTPFSFIATTTSILWEHCEPVFVDIDPKTLCMDPEKIEEAISDKTEAILATHVFGIPCDVEKIEEIAKRHHLKVIYDAAHAFGVKYKGESVLKYGDLSTISFHATKLFHTVEGGAIVNNTGEKLDHQITLLRNFGYEGEDYITAGINAKNSEFHAAMGLCNLKHIDEIIMKRRIITETYEQFLGNRLERPFISNDIQYNYAYYPVIFETEEELLFIKSKLERNQIMTRRYFYPSLNKIPYLKNTYSCKISESIAKRILCLPLYSDLHLDDVENIAKLMTGESRNELTYNGWSRIYRF
ncbi:DegT/DnrJ/EryC1/StrS family aminotransferase [Bacillus sp. BRMEA1]|uniref:DegT/DnrJ/EryC1/StrS family aminotransferase n=1 Tax=Neobacillus endophyticus TaxID=2738405 RepID=UPI0015670778|nr:DegT/DnrJ/EryC1/StrS family aminotransferase [Neobacillus endophyticus]NRD76326.1 DegT/DnrJ/EryC1/StrS family aminotransferase [Neobacillus endophyticus]